MSVPENLWGYGKRYEFVRTTLAELGASTVLDIGCGNGSQLAIPLSEAGFTVTAIDTDPKSIARGRGLSDRVHFVLGEVADLPPATYDAVILSEVLEHLHDPETLLSAAERYLSPNGVMIVTVPNGYGEFELDKRLFAALRLQPAFDAVSNAARRLSRRPRRGTIPGSDDESPHLQRFTLGRLRKMFRDQGLRVIARRSSSFASGPFVAYTLGRIPGFVAFNAKIADRLPMVLTGGWMFALQR